MARRTLKNPGQVTVREPGGQTAAHGYADNKLHEHCGGIWIDRFTWADGYQPPTNTDHVYELYYESATDRPIARGHVSPDAPTLPATQGKPDVAVCFDVVEATDEYFV